MTEFETEGVLQVVVDQQSLRDARDEVQETIGSVTVSASGGRARADGGSGVMASIDDSAMVDELDEQTDLLEDILDELEQGGVGGGGGGLGGGGMGGGLGLGLGAGGAAGTAMSGLTLAGGALVGAGLGVAGAGVLESTGVLDATEGAGSATRQTLPGADVLGDAAVMAPGVGLAAALGELGTGDLAGAQQQFQRAQESRQQVVENNDAEQVADRAQLSQGLVQLATGDTGGALSTFGSVLAGGQNDGSANTDERVETNPDVDVEEPPDLSLDQDTRQFLADYELPVGDLPDDLNLAERMGIRTGPSPADSRSERLGQAVGPSGQQTVDPRGQMNVDRYLPFDTSGMSRQEKLAVMMGPSPAQNTSEQRAIRVGPSPAPEDKRASGGGGQQQGQQRQQITMRNDITVPVNLDMSNLRELQEFLQNTDRYLNKKLGGLGGSF